VFPDVNPLTRVLDQWSPLAEASRELLRTTQDGSGAWPAAPRFEPYGYSWFRDGSFIAEGASATGLHAEAEAFHAWCAEVLRRERPAVDRVVGLLAEGRSPADSDYLPARYSLDGTRHEDDWWNFQVDGYGTWMWALERHLLRTRSTAASFADAVETAVLYLVATGRETCRDWWEENRDETHVATLAGVAAGLRAAVRMGVLDPPTTQDAERVADLAVADIRRDGVRDDHLVKWLGGADVDASLLAVAALYDVLPLDDPLVVRTVDLVELRLTTPGGGVHRYEADTFYGGGQWPVLAALLAWHHVRAGDRGRAAELLDWVVSVADEQLQLPEQVPPLLAPDVLDEWLERWGPSAHPLVWSHGMFLGALAQWCAAG
jgi:isomaltose glucohydrolase